MSAELQEQLVFTNEFKIRFCNGAKALIDHAEDCGDCAWYLHKGEGDLCESGKNLIKKAMVLQ